MEVFIQPEIINLFDEDGVIDVNDNVASPAVASSTCPGGCQPFNPFTETPVEGVHYRLGDRFGQPEEEDDLQLVRTFRFSVGVRFNPN